MHLEVPAREERQLFYSNEASEIAHHGHTSTPHPAHILSFWLSIVWICISSPGSSHISLLPRSPCTNHPRHSVQFMNPSPPFLRAFALTGLPRLLFPGFANPAHICCYGLSVCGSLPPPTTFICWSPNLQHDSIWSKK